MAENEFTDFYEMAIAVCGAAIVCSDGSTDFERKAVTSIQYNILPRLAEGLKEMKAGGTGSFVEDMMSAAAHLEAACNTVLCALDGSNQEERNVISNAKSILNGIQSAFDQIGIDITISIAEYGEPIPDVEVGTGRNARTSYTSTSSSSSSSSGGCYIATAAYGSYDCPQVWVLRRYRDNKLAKSTAGRAFIKCYYAISPKLVKAFGGFDAVNKANRSWLDRFVAKLQREGYDDTPYQDK